MQGTVVVVPISLVIMFAVGQVVVSGGIILSLVIACSAAAGLGALAFAVFRRDPKSGAIFGATTVGISLLSAFVCAFLALVLALIVYVIGGYTGAFATDTGLWNTKPHLDFFMFMKAGAGVGAFLGIVSSIMSAREGDF